MFSLQYRFLMLPKSIETLQMESIPLKIQNLVNTNNEYNEFLNIESPFKE